MRKYLLASILFLVTGYGWCMNERTPLTTKTVQIPLDDQCGICQEVLRPPIIALRCGHYFCESCINQWRAANGGSATCPLCRAPVPAVEVVSQRGWNMPLIINEGNEPHGRCCCSWTRCSKACQLFDNHALDPCSSCACLYGSLSCCCCCSCMDSRGRIIPCLEAARCLRCSCYQPLQDISNDWYVSAMGTMCCASFITSIVLLSILHQAYGI